MKVDVTRDGEKVDFSWNIYDIKEAANGWMIHGTLQVFEKREVDEDGIKTTGTYRSSVDWAGVAEDPDVRVANLKALSSAAEIGSVTVSIQATEELPDLEPQE